MVSASVNAFVFIAFTNRLKKYVKLLLRKTSRTLSNSSEPPLSPRTTVTLEAANAAFNENAALWKKYSMWWRLLKYSNRLRCHTGYRCFCGGVVVTRSLTAKTGFDPAPWKRFCLCASLAPCEWIALHVLHSIFIIVWAGLNRPITLLWHMVMKNSSFFTTRLSFLFVFKHWRSSEWWQNPSSELVKPFSQNIFSSWLMQINRPQIVSLL